MIKIGINGFGRIGRLAFRVASKSNDVEVVAINDLLDVDHLAYLLKYDSVHGKYDGEISVLDGEMIVDGKSIRVSLERNPEQLKWDEIGAEIILECTGIFKELASASAHIRAGAKKVVISAPSKTAPMFVIGVNHTKVTPNDTIVSSASCTTNCLAPLVKIINDNVGIVEGLMTTIHATTSSQLTVDGPKSSYRKGRSAINNIIPTSTGAAQAVSKVIPELEGKLSGMAFRVPTANVSVVDVTLRTEKPTTINKINSFIKEAATGDYSGVVQYIDDEVVSQDFVSETHTCNYDSKASIGLNDNFFKLVAWYDNEYGYASKFVDLVIYISKL